MQILDLHAISDEKENIAKIVKYLKLSIKMINIYNVYI